MGIASFDTKLPTSDFSTLYGRYLAPHHGPHTDAKLSDATLLPKRNPQIRSLQIRFIHYKNNWFFGRGDRVTDGDMNLFDRDLRLIFPNIRWL